ncbi:MAG: hypothetical protein ACLP9S_12175 [Syntrophales bacterium]
MLTEPEETPPGERLSPGKPEADFANLIALGFSTFETPDDSVRNSMFHSTIHKSNL